MKSLPQAGCLQLTELHWFFTLTPVHLLKTRPACLHSNRKQTHACSHRSHMKKCTSHWLNKADTSFVFILTRWDVCKCSGVRFMTCVRLIIWYSKKERSDMLHFLGQVRHTQRPFWKRRPSECLRAVHIYGTKSDIWSSLLWFAHFCKHFENILSVWKHCDIPKKKKTAWQAWTDEESVCNMNGFHASHSVGQYIQKLHLHWLMAHVIR